MRHRIYVPALPAGGEIVVTGDEFHHAARVARVREHEEVELFDGKGGAAAGHVESLGQHELVVHVDGAISSREANIDMTIAMSIIQLEKFELVLQKVTELGARSIVPLVTDRIELRPERYRGKRDRWEKIVLEAVKQSGRSAIPAVRDPMTFEQVATHGGLRIVFDADAEPTSLPDHVETVTLLIGPEGGWSEREIEVARGAGCAFQRLGSRRLRAETAAIVATATMGGRAGELD